ncbi:MAG TPA: CPBP family intramembrane glutamic endopeptidase [Blastocatellia bacterium]|jgi:membrane protease YdiL (CAAX protease family)|nr:CPBP family intramembrane glutamic endopeptidase [Blastocatellia bacterium]
MGDDAGLGRRFFINEEGELRSGWRVLVFFALYMLAASLLSLALRVLVSFVPSLVFLFFQPSTPDEGVTNRQLVYLGVGQLINISAAVAASAACARLLERRSLASVGYKRHRGWLRDFWLGSILGAASLGLAVAIAAAAGAVGFETNTHDGALLARGFVVLFFLFLVSGAFEELLFRGFAFQALYHDVGPLAAVVITSTLFGLAHFDNNNASIFSTVNTMIAGAWLAAACVLTRSLWLATALHYSWNFVMVFVFGLPISGFSTFNQLTWLRGHNQPPEWVSGGSYGPEGGAAATIALILSTVAMWKSGLFKPSEEMLAAIRHGKPEPRHTGRSLDDHADM